MGLSQDALPAEVVRRQYVASATGDLEALRATLAPDVEWTEMAGFPLAGTYRTPESVTANVMEAIRARKGNRRAGVPPGATATPKEPRRCTEMATARSSSNL